MRKARALGPARLPSLLNIIPRRCGGAGALRRAPFQRHASAIPAPICWIDESICGIG